GGPVSPPGVLQGSGRGPLPGPARERVGRGPICLLPPRAPDEGVDASRTRGDRPQVLPPRDRNGAGANGQGTSRAERARVVPARRLTRRRRRPAPPTKTNAATRRSARDDFLAPVQAGALASSAWRTSSSLDAARSLASPGSCSACSAGRRATRTARAPRR